MFEAMMSITWGEWARLVMMWAGFCYIATWIGRVVFWLIGQDDNSHFRQCRLDGLRRVRAGWGVRPDRQWLIEDRKLRSRTGRARRAWNRFRANPLRFTLGAGGYRATGLVARSIGI